MFVHRDYMPRNLMVSEPNPGVLDFQDAVFGPVTYDVVSLFRDAFVSWPEARVLDWSARYWEQAKKAGVPVPDDFAAFYRDFEWMGLQRHLKVIGIFARIHYRDGNPATSTIRSFLGIRARYPAHRARPLTRILDAIAIRVARFAYLLNAMSRGGTRDHAPAHRRTPKPLLEAGGSAIARGPRAARARRFSRARHQRLASRQPHESALATTALGLAYRYS